MGANCSYPQAWFNLNCQACPRLVPFLSEVRAKYPGYHGLPVPPVGEVEPKLLVVGLAPGMHGANATGRPFTGDYAGGLLYQTLYDFGFTNQPQSTDLEDGLQLIGCRITNAVKCLPPQNKPTSAEINACNGFLQQELLDLPAGVVVLALGTIAHKAVLKAFQMKQSGHPFAHNVQHPLPNGRWLVDSYHTSKYNILTKRLTPDMFRDVFARIQNLCQNESV